MNEKKESTQKLTKIFSDLLAQTPEDPERAGLFRTPQRAAKAFRYLTHGYELNLEDVVQGALFPSKCDEMVIVKDIELFSMCEHHMLPIIGKCHVGYIPTGKILGLSKIARIVDMYARRLQIQENLNMEIAEAIMSVTDAEGVGVVIDAYHLCVMARGVEKQHSIMKTSTMLGSFRDDGDVRSEFLSLIK